MARKTPELHLLYKLPYITSGRTSDPLRMIYRATAPHSRRIFSGIGFRTRKPFRPEAETLPLDHRNSFEVRVHSFIHTIADIVGLFSELGLPSLTTVNHCRTPDGLPGECGELSKCIYLIFDMVRLRRSVCFRNLFMVGICCPGTSPSTTTEISTPNETLLQETTESSTVSTEATTTTTASTTTTTTTTTERPNLTTTKIKRLSQKATKKPFSTSTVIAHTTSKPTTTTIKGIEIFTTPETTEEPYILATEESTQNFTYSSEFRCGAAGRDGRIVGGYEANPGQWPWMAAIFLDSYRGREYWCGGALVGTWYILTAAHCLSDQRGRKYRKEQLTVRLGDHHLFRTDDFMNPIEFKVAATIPHPQFSRSGFYNDIALLKLRHSVTYSEYISPVCLPTPGLKANTLVGYMGTVTGWGTLSYGESFKKYFIHRENSAAYYLKYAYSCS
ncbi:Proclotting enzyme [Araneus ventricosus]|uniref:Proclotting enzyme n=1 Tax=Araneus ventricosus TaxID=182803 RepID=A0A4Y1ZXS7_ARAVE|nr:Proclotting enzyme [Araneus ventricosus]